MFPLATLDTICLFYLHNKYFKLVINNKIWRKPFPLWMAVEELQSQMNEMDLYTEAQSPPDIETLQLNSPSSLDILKEA
jgi:hypothetical protein